MAERLKLTLKRKGGDPVAALRPHARSFSGGGFSILHDFEDEASALPSSSESRRAATRRAWRWRRSPS